MTSAAETKPITIAGLRRRGALQSVSAVSPGDPDKQVQRVVLVDHLDRLRTLAPHSLIVLTGDAAAGGWSLAVALRAAWERNAAAVVAPAGACSGSAAELAKRLRLALFGAERDVMDLAIELAAEVSHPAALLDRRTARCAMLLSEQNTVRGVLGVINTELDGVPVAFTTAGELLAGRAAALRQSDNTRQLSVPVTGPGGEAWGQLVASMPHNERRQTDEVVAVLKLARAPIVAALARLRLDVTRRIAREQSAFRRLRATARDVGKDSAPPTAVRLADQDATPAWATDLGWQLNGWLVGIYLVQGDVRDTPPTLENTTMTADWWSECLPTMPLVAGEDGWISWAVVQSEDGQEAAVARRLQRELAEVAAARDVAVGVGRAHRGPSGLITSVEEGRLAARSVAAGQIRRFADLGLRAVLGCLPRPQIETMGVLVMPALFAAKDRDLLATTILAVLDCGGSLGQAATLLGVHRNTVLARIGRAREIGIHLDDPRQRLALHALCFTLAGPAYLSE